MRPVAIAPVAMREMRRIAEEARPREACAFMEGTLGHVQRIHPTKNVHETPETRYAVDPLEFLRLDESLEGTGRQVVGVFHSHPKTHAVPSATDRLHAQPGWIYVLLGFPPEAPGGELRAWHLPAADAEFEEIAVETNATTGKEVSRWA